MVCVIIGSYGSATSEGVGQLYKIIINELLLFSVENEYHEFGNSMEDILREVTLLMGSGSAYVKSVDFVD
jgi:hypothetical protein